MVIKLPKFKVDLFELTVKTIEWHSSLLELMKGMQLQKHFPGVAFVVPQRMVEIKKNTFVITASIFIRRGVSLVYTHEAGLSHYPGFMPHTHLHFVDGQFPV